MAFLNGFGVLFWIGLIVFIAGRFHWLLRDKTHEGDFPTRLSSGVRFGSVGVTLILWAIDLGIKVAAARR